jgi:hypothetical protein
VANRDHSASFSASPEICGAVKGVIYNDTLESCLCTAGYSSFYDNNCLQCVENFDSFGNNQECKSCPSGRWSDAGSSACKNCDSADQNPYCGLSVGNSKAEKILWVTAVVIASLFVFGLVMKKGANVP